MIYTIGHTNSYNRYFAEQGTPQKLGKTDSYVGGSVWLDRSAAQSYLDKNSMNNYSVYGVLAAIDDTEYIEGQSFRNLIKTSTLVRLDDGEYSHKA